MRITKTLTALAACAVALSALQPFSPSALSSTAPVNVPASMTLDLTKKPTLFMVGYSHLDTQWRWGYPQTIREFLPSTFNDNLRLFDEFPSYTFNFTGASRYKLIKDYYPAAFEKIRAAVAAGLWWPNGVAWEENDPNAPSVESQIRQFLQGNEFFKKEFGAESNEFMLPDCFGFPASLPSVLCHCGIRGFSTQKLEWGSANGIPFNVGEWIGLDGNSVIAALNALAYDRNIEQNPATDPAWLKRITDNGGKSGIYADFTYMGTGDIGGAPPEISVANMEAGARAADAPVRVVCAAADLMFNSITDAQMKNLPKYAGDLLLTEHSAGSITSQAYMKHWNRANELLADAAERASVAAWLLGAAPYPREKLNGAWQIMLRSQFHDMLPGTCIPKAYEYAWNDEVLCMNTFAEVLTNAVGAVASGLDTRADPGAVPLVVYNPLAIDREDVVEATVHVPDARDAKDARDARDTRDSRDTEAAKPAGPSQATPSVQVFDSAGKPVPAQLLSRDGDTVHIAFLARVPSVGFAVYFPCVPCVPCVPFVPSQITVTPRTLENPRYRVTLNDAGDIASIFDKQQNRELLAAPACLAFQTENPRNWPAWNMDWADRQNPPRACVGDGASGKPAQIEIVERGPVRVALRVTRDAEGSRFEQTIRLSAGDAGNRVEISNTIDWQTKASSLKATFPLTVSNTLATYNEDLGKIQRANNDPKKYEVPAHQWFDLTDKSGASGVTILTAAKYGSDKPDDNTVRLTLLYTPGLERARDYREQRWQDWGRHDFTYGIYAHAGDWRAAGSDWQALRMEQPLLAFRTTQHPGPLGRSFSLLQLTGDNAAAIAVRAIKLAEDSDKIIVRLQELNGAPQTNVRLVTNAAPIGNVSEVNGVEKFLTPVAFLPGNAGVPSADEGRPDPRPAHAQVAGRPLSAGGTPALPLTFTKYQLRTLALTPAPAAPPLLASPESPASAESGVQSPESEIQSPESGVQSPASPKPAKRIALPPAASTPVTLPYNMSAFGWRGATAPGDFDGQGATFPAEMIADIVTSEGITFKIGPRAAPVLGNAGVPPADEGRPASRPIPNRVPSEARSLTSKIENPLNAVRCEGQTIALPSGDFNRVYLLAASADGDTSGNFSVADKDGATLDTPLTIQNWTGYIGSWDNRVFEGEVPENAVDQRTQINNPLARIDAGFIKRAPVAWYCDHHYTKGGKDAIYSYCYLFKYALALPPGAKTVTLPNTPNIRVFAMTAANDPAAGTRPARPLYDDFTNRPPIVIPEGWANSK